MGVAKALRTRDKGRHERLLLTINGAITVERRYQWDPRLRSGRFPADACLGVNKHGHSPGIRQAMCRFASNDCFDRAAADLERFVGVRMCKQTLRAAVLREGAAVAADRASGKIAPEFTAADAGTVGPDGLPGPTRLNASMDGVFVRMVTQAEQDRRLEKAVRKRAERGRDASSPRPLRERAGHAEAFKEMKVGAFYDQSRRHMHTFVTPGGPNDAGELLARHAALLRFDQADQRGAVFDGAPWIKTQFRERLSTIELMLLDFYHLSEHLHEGGGSAFADADEAGAWVAKRSEEFKAGHAATALAAIRALRAKTTTPGSQETLRRLDEYVTARLDMLDYARAIAQGRDIGSGPMESQCKTHTMRVDRPGAKWLANNAASIMNLAALQASGQWESHWKKLAA